MTGAYQRRDDHGGRQRPRVAVLLWLLTALSVLQWTVPPVDPGLLALLNAGKLGRHDPAVAEWQAPAIEARASSSLATSEKRSPNSRSQPPAADDPYTDAANLSVPASGRTTAATAAPAAMPRARVGDGFTARSPPGFG